jgi:hypothetical protein
VSRCPAEDGAGGAARKAGRWRSVGPATPSRVLTRTSHRPNRVCAIAGWTSTRRRETEDIRHRLGIDAPIAEVYDTPPPELDGRSTRRAPGMQLRMIVSSMLAKSLVVLPRTSV